MRGAGKGIHEYLLELPSETISDHVCRRRRAHPLSCEGIERGFAAGRRKAADVPAEAVRANVLRIKVVTRDIMLPSFEIKGREFFCGQRLKSLAGKAGRLRK